MTKVLYTGGFRFPEGDAAAGRVYAVGQFFEQFNCTVSFAGWEKSRSEDGYYRYKNHDCFSQGEFRDCQLNTASRLIGFLFRGFKTLKWLWHHREYDVVVAYNPPALFSLGLLLTGWVVGSRVVLDNTEWYEGSHLPGGRFGPASIENWVRMQLVYPLFRHVICISRLLEDHFSGRNVVRLPPLIVEFCYPAEKPSVETMVSFIYAGEAGKKDKLLPFIKTLPNIHKLLNRPVLLRIAGMDWEMLCKLMKSENIDHENFKNYVECYGHVNRDRVKELYAISHFSILFRENQRFAHAGFPTKAMESWFNGCPIITNPVGDLGFLAKDMVNAILVDENLIEERIPIALKMIVDDYLYLSMSTACIKDALHFFTLDAYRGEFQKFAAQLGINSET